MANAATHAVVVTDVTLKDTSWHKRVWAPNEEPPAELSKLDLAVEALRIVTSVPTGYAQVYLRPHGWADRWLYDLPPIHRVGTFRRYPAAFDEWGWLKQWPKVPAQQLQLLPVVHQAVQNTDKATRLAIRRLSLANLRDDEDDKLVDACIGIEALLSNDSTEIAHKIATRGAAALSRHRQPPMDSRALFAALKTIYARRSGLVHGTATGKHTVFKLPNDESVSTVELASMLLRELLLSKLTSQTGWTVDSLDEDILASLMSSVGAENSQNQLDAN